MGRGCAALRQRNAYLLQPYEGPEQVQRIRSRMLAPLKVCAGRLPDTANISAGQLARAGESADRSARRRG